MYGLLTAIWAHALASAVLTQAYIIDDSNTTVQYSGPWSHDVSAPSPALDPTKLYSGTCTYAVCSAGQNCHVQIPFTGSGITVFNLLWVQINASFVVDGGSSQLYVHDDSCFHTTPAGCYDIETFTLQSLRYDNHLLDIALLAYNGGTSNFVFDYAIVNDTVTPSSSGVASATVPSMSTSNTSSAASSPSHGSSAAIAGGVVGGLAVIAAFVIALLYLRMKNRQKTATETFRGPIFQNTSPLPPQPPIPTHMAWAGMPPTVFDTTTPGQLPPSATYPQTTAPTHVPNMITRVAPASRNFSKTDARAFPVPNSTQGLTVSQVNPPHSLAGPVSIQTTMDSGSVSQDLGTLSGDGATTTSATLPTAGPPPEYKFKS